MATPDQISPPATCHGTLGVAGVKHSSTDPVYMGSNFSVTSLGAFNHYTAVHEHEYEISSDINACGFINTHYPSAVYDAEAPEPGVGPCVDAAKYSTRAGQKFRGPPLVTPGLMPEWVATATPADARARLSGHLKAALNGVSEITGVSVYSWDVLSELLTPTVPTGDDEGKPTVWSVPTATANDLTKVFGAAGDAALTAAFSLLAAEAGDAKLCYSDVNLEKDPAKAAAVLAMLVGAKAAAAIDCVALQTHLDVENAPSIAEMSTLITAFGTAGFEVHITDLAVKCDACAGSDEVALERQALVYRDMLQACVMAPGVCTVFQTDGFQDGSHGGDDLKYALPFAADLSKKPAYSKMLDVLNRRKCDDHRSSTAALKDT